MNDNTIWCPRCYEEGKILLAHYELRQVPHNFVIECIHHGIVFIFNQVKRAESIESKPKEELHVNEPLKHINYLINETLKMKMEIKKIELYLQSKENHLSEKNHNNLFENINHLILNINYNLNFQLKVCKGE